MFKRYGQIVKDNRDGSFTVSFKDGSVDVIGEDNLFFKGGLISE
jgi:hypothetical protein